MEEMTAETNVEEFDEYEGDADLVEESEEQEPELEAETERETNNEAEGAESSLNGGEGETDAEFAEPQKKPWKTEENAKAAQARRERERREIEERAYRKGVVDSVAGINPYTHGKIEDEADIEEYLAMREIETGGGDPLTDFASFTKKKAREQAQKLADESKKDEQSAWYHSDLSSFAEKHPDIDFQKLSEDPEFNFFSEGKIGRHSLNEIYEKYIGFKSEYERRAQKQAQKIVSRSLSSPGALGGGAAEKTVTDADIDSYIDAAIRGKLD